MALPVFEKMVSLSDRESPWVTFFILSGWPTDVPLTPALSESAERLDLSLFGKLKALSLSKGSPTGLVAGRNKHEGLKSK